MGSQESGAGSQQKLGAGAHAERPEVQAYGPKAGIAAPPKTDYLPLHAEGRTASPGAGPLGFADSRLLTPGSLLRILGVLCFLCGLLLGTAQAATYYVATTGANNSSCGTQAAPCATIAYVDANKSLMAGDVVRVTCHVGADYALPPGGNCDISLKFTPTSTGVKNGSVTVYSNASGSPHTYDLTGTGVSAQATLQLGATYLAFGNQAVGWVSAERTVMVSNTGSSDFEFSGLAVSGDFALGAGGTCSSSQPILPGSSCTVAVAFAPTATGTRTGALTISGSASNSPQTVDLSGTGVASLRLASGVKINPGVRLVRFASKQAVPVFIQGAQGGAGSGTVTYLTPAIVQAKSCQANNVGSLTCTFNAAQTAGNVNAVVVTWLGAADINYLSDSAYNYYVRVFSATTRSGNISQNIYRTRAIAAKTGNVVTVVLTGTTTAVDVQLAEISNLDTASGPYDSSVATGGNTGVTATVETSPFVTSVPTEMLLLGGGTTARFSEDQAGTGYTKQQVTPWGDLLAYKVVTSAGSQTGKAIVNAGDWILQAVGFKAKSTTSQGTGAAASFAGANTAGNFIAAVVDWQDGSHTLSGVSDSAGNAYSLARYDTYTSSGITLRQAIYYAKNIAAAAAGNTVTASFSGDNLPTLPHVRILEYGGLDKDSPLEVAAGKSGTVNSPSGRTLIATDPQATSVDSELVIGGALVTYGLDSVPATDPPTNLRLLAADRSNLVADRILGNRGSYDLAAYLQASSQLWLIQAAYFKAAGQTGETPAPELYSVIPASGPTPGGASVTLAGRNFRAGATVNFGGAPATGIQAVSDTVITATTPAHAAGAVDVEVINPDGLRAVLAGGFQYDSPSSRVLTVNWAGVGSGGVTSTPAGVACHTPDNCQASFAQGAVVTLSAAADAGFVFAGWSGACTGTGGCVVTMDNDAAVTANFTIQDSYSIVFSSLGAQNPLSDSHRWVNGGSCADPTLCAGTTSPWPGSTNVVVDASGHAYGTDSTSYPTDDSSASVAGVWAADQQACATVYRSVGNEGYNQEVEIHLRDLTQNGSKGKMYEAYWHAYDCASCTTPYESFARWNGNGTYYQPSGWAANAAAYSIVTGDKVCAKVEGANPVTLTAWIENSSGVEKTGSRRSVTDSDAGRITAAGHPGIGFYINDSLTNSNAGFTAFSAASLSAPPPPASFTLAVNKNGSGTVSGLSPHDEIQCGSTCSYAYPAGTSVTLHAVAAPGSQFNGWTGACSGSGDCVLTLNGDATVTAMFGGAIYGDYYVATGSSSASDSNPGTLALPWKTIQHAADVAPAGSTIAVLAGVYPERVTISRSNLTFQGEMNYSAYRTVIDPSVAISGGWTLSELGNGVYKRAFATPVSNIMIDGAGHAGTRRNIFRIADVPQGTAGWGPGAQSQQDLLTRGANSTTTEVQDGDCTHPFWDGIEALWAWHSGYVYLRFRNGDNPNGMTLYVTTNSLGYEGQCSDMQHCTGIVNITGSYNTLKDIWVRGDRIAVSLSGASATGNQVRGNYLTATRVVTIGGQKNVTVDSNDITFNGYGTSGDFHYTAWDQDGFGPWANAGLTGDRTCMQKFLYSPVTKRWLGIGDGVNDHIGVIDLSAGVDGVTVSNNRIHDTVLNVFLGSRSGGSANWYIHDNLIENSSADSIAPWQYADPIYIYDNRLYHVNMAVRGHQLGVTNRRIYYYRNKIWDCGKECFYHWWQNPVAAADRTYIYHNSYSGGLYTSDFAFRFSGNGGTVPNEHFFNNIVSDGHLEGGWGGGMGCLNDGSGCIASAFGRFGYNWIGGYHGTIPPWTPGTGNIVKSGTVYAWPRSRTTEPDWNPPADAVGQALGISSTFTLGTTTFTGGMPGFAPGTPGYKSYSGATNMGAEVQ